MRRLEPYWYPIILLLCLGYGLYVYHLLTGYTPPRAALNIFGFEVYWYGIWIVAGITVGAIVVTRLALDRAEKAYADTVPADVRERPLGETQIPDDLLAHLDDETSALGDVLWQHGLDPRRLGLDKDDRARMEAALLAEPDVLPEWVADTAWRQWNPDHVWNGLIIVLILGVIGARLYHVLTPSPSMAAIGITSPIDYFRNPAQILNFRSGGLGIYGAIVGGLLGLLIYTWRNKLSALAWTDLAVVGLAIGQAIGRFGNFFNQELYGEPTTVPWAIFIEPIYRLPDYANFETFHPAFLYESLWSLGTFLVLLWLVRRKREQLLPGEVMAAYFVAYAIGRSLLELVRLDSRTVALLGVETELAVATVVSLVAAALMVAWVVIRRWRRGRPGGPAAGAVNRQVNAG